MSRSYHNETRVFNFTRTYCESYEISEGDGRILGDVDRSLIGRYCNRTMRNIDKMKVLIIAPNDFRFLRMMSPVVFFLLIASFGDVDLPSIDIVSHNFFNSDVPMDDLVRDNREGKHSLPSKSCSNEKWGKFLCYLNSFYINDISKSILYFSSYLKNSWESFKRPKFILSYNRHLPFDQQFNMRNYDFSGYKRRLIQSSKYTLFSRIFYGLGFENIKVNLFSLRGDTGGVGPWQNTSISQRKPTANDRIGNSFSLIPPSVSIGSLPVPSGQWFRDEREANIMRNSIHNLCHMKISSYHKQEVNDGMVRNRSKQSSGRKRSGRRIGGYDNVFTSTRFNGDEAELYQLLVTSSHLLTVPSVEDVVTINNSSMIDCNRRNSMMTLNHHYNTGCKDKLVHNVRISSSLSQENGVDRLVKRKEAQTDVILGGSNDNDSISSSPLLSNHTPHWQLVIYERDENRHIRNLEEFAASLRLELDKMKQIESRSVHHASSSSSSSSTSSSSPSSSSPLSKGISPLHFNWNLQVLYHSDDMHPCLLHAVLEQTDVLITPHGFQATGTYIQYLLLEG